MELFLERGTEKWEEQRELMLIDIIVKGDTLFRELE